MTCSPNNPFESALPGLRDGDTIFRLQPQLEKDFAAAGLVDFEACWNLPADYVDEVNQRRGGWSAVTRLSVTTDQGTRIFFIKRQENQLRRSPAHPLGILTYQFELEAIQTNLSLGLPAVEVAGIGLQRAGKKRRGILITEQLPAQSLTEISSQRPDWKQLMPLLEKAGSLLCDMHLHKISHGAFYPNHLYLNPTSGQVFLIDFERSRRCLTAASAVRRDLYQFLKRASVMPVSALEQLLASHRRQFPKLTEQLVNHYHANRTV